MFYTILPFAKYFNTKEAPFRVTGLGLVELVARATYCKWSLQFASGDLDVMLVVTTRPGMTATAVDVLGSGTEAKLSETSVGPLLNDLLPNPLELDLFVGGLDIESVLIILGNSACRHVRFSFRSVEVGELTLT
ncbi:MAG: hypothetical protein HY226_01565 [Candidatus Vogelbacteria bacterium]|nr:hypothetical protein [Candidatus Vogelbacteria bacterium]